MRSITLVIVLLVLVVAAPVLAQGGDGNLPPTTRLEGLRHEYQGWNNCGPATLATALSYFGWSGDQAETAAWLKPDPEDKNVTAAQLAEYVNTFTEQRALVRYGGSLTLLRQLVAAEFPVIIAAGYQPDGFDWMGHYLLVSGYDDDAGTLLTQDSFRGPDMTYPQTEVDAYWRHFNRLFVVIYPPARETDLLTLLGEDADPATNAARALETARLEASAAPEDPFAWFNLGTSFALLEQFTEAATAFDQARNTGDGLPWRMLWYQFGPFEAYYQTGRFDDVLALVQYNLATTPEEEHAIEETYFYAGLAREALGEPDRAALNFQQALQINPNFRPAVAALNDLEATPGQ